MQILSTSPLDEIYCLTIVIMATNQISQLKKELLYIIHVAWALTTSSFMQ